MVFGRLLNSIICAVNIQTGGVQQGKKGRENGQTGEARGRDRVTVDPPISPITLRSHSCLVRQYSRSPYRRIRSALVKTFLLAT